MNEKSKLLDCCTKVSKNNPSSNFAPVLISEKTKEIRLKLNQNKRITTNETKSKRDKEVVNPHKEKN